MSDKSKKPKKQYRVESEIEFREVNLGKPASPMQKYQTRIKGGRYVRNSGLVNS